ncbi:MAG: alpha-L-fucosidase [Clostridiales bacterium]|jgi:alpha-L-fucosidase|nr:alpha-L-fucosidase [Clostridiales bacterium]
MNKFEANFNSLSEAGCPQWFRDAKFGIWSHWGAQSVPMYGDWYARNMYIEGSPQYLYHVRHYGHPSKFGYKDICALWKAENFDPDSLMELYYKAGARYFVAQAMHHDHFFNYPSKLNRMNSVQVGPMKDICGLWQKAAQRLGLPFGLTEHLGASFSWSRVNKGFDEYGPFKGVPYDGNDPAWQDFYFDNREHGINNKGELYPWYTPNKNFQKYWLDVMRELIDLYTPDLLYSDGALPFGEIWADAHIPNPDEANYALGLEAVARLYNASAAKYGKNQAVYTQKDRRSAVYRVGILDIEKSQLPDINPEPWQTDTCIGNWFYDVRQHYKHADQIAEMLVDIISKNGTMLLNVLQKPDGTIDDEAEFILKELAAWFKINAEGVYGTRPWKISGEGITKVHIEGFREDKTSWNETDFRFVKKDNTVYAFMMSLPRGGAAVLRSFNEGENISAVRLLGLGNLEFKHEFGVLTVKMPENMPSDFANCIAITLK